MTKRTVYLLDSDVFMQAQRMYYAFDVAPAFWDALIKHSKKGNVFSIDKVLDEIERGKDELTDWANGDFNPAFLSTRSGAVIKAYGEVINNVLANTQYKDAAKETFGSGADGWLIAYAKSEGFTVVTLEQSEPLSRKEVKIPDVCNVFGVPWINTFQMLRNLGIKLG